MGIYYFTLPDTPPLAKAEKLSLDSVFPREALNLLRERSMLVFGIASFLICIPLQFYYAFRNLFLNQAGVSNAAGKMTGGQISEVICMILYGREDLLWECGDRRRARLLHNARSEATKR
jgi:hypothetical protein